MTVQANIPPALMVIHNFSAIHDPDQFTPSTVPKNAIEDFEERQQEEGEEEEEEEGGGEEEEEEEDEEDEEEEEDEEIITGLISATERREAEKRRDRIATAMWENYRARRV
jgi:hypothetical protein